MIFLFSGSFCFWWKSSGVSWSLLLHSKINCIYPVFPCCLLVSSISKKPMFLVGCTCKYFLILTLHLGDPYTHTVHGKHLLGLLVNSIENQIEGLVQRSISRLRTIMETLMSPVFGFLTTASGYSLCKGICIWQPLWWHFWPGVPW